MYIYIYIKIIKKLTSDCLIVFLSKTQVNTSGGNGKKITSILTDCVDRHAVRHQAKRVVEDAAAMEDGGRESQQTGEEVLQFAKHGALWIRQLREEVVLAEWKHWNQACPVENRMFIHLISLSTVWGEHHCVCCTVVCFHSDNLKQNKAQSARAESMHKGVNS